MNRRSALRGRATGATCGELIAARVDGDAVLISVLALGPAAFAESVDYVSEICACRRARDRTQPSPACLLALTWPENRQTSSSNP
jgi:hypothetical protein